jgi:ketosteroid isomerase-like protein
MNEAEFHLADRAVIHDLLVRVAFAQDANDWEALADCFTPDATYAYPGGNLVGADLIVGRARTALTPLDASQHLLGTILVTVEGHKADTVCYFQSQHVRYGAPGGDLYAIAGTYCDRLEKGDDGCWRIVHRTQQYTWRDGNPEVIRRAPSQEKS